MYLFVGEIMAKAIRRTTGKGGNYRPTKNGAGKTQKGIRAYRRPTHSA